MWAYGLHKEGDMPRLRMFWDRKALFHLRRYFRGSGLLLTPSQVVDSRSEAEQGWQGTLPRALGKLTLLVALQI
ncbi:MAG: hypothetical protein ACJAWL_003549 [Motiliproteus sp.]|jgi:hypothetical protein